MTLEQIRLSKHGSHFCLDTVSSDEAGECGVEGKGSGSEKSSENLRDVLRLPKSAIKTEALPSKLAKQINVDFR